MSGRVVFRRGELNGMFACDLTGKHTSMKDLMNSFWSQHAHQDIVVEWSCVTLFDTTIYHATTSQKARDLKEVREGLGHRCSPVRFDRQSKNYTFVEYADDVDVDR